MRKIRISIFAVTMMLVALGVIMVYSSSAIYAYEKMGDGYFFLKKHLLFLAAGLAGALFFMSFDYRNLRRFSKPIIFASVLPLILLLFPSIGSEVGGARRWFRIGGFSFQPSEFSKLAIIIYLADFLERKSSYINEPLKTLLPLLLVMSLVMGLILLQPDLGTVVVICSIAFILLFAARINGLYIAGLFALSLPVLWLLILRVPYRMNRIRAFLNPWRDPKGTGFQIIQSFIALGAGGIFGVGLGKSTQKLFYLPEAHTDFIFSIIGEELGLAGTLSVMALFIALIWQGMRVVFKTEDSFGRYLSLGIVSMIALEVIINIGVTIGALPTKGLPLPFISYGGSSLIVHMMAIGLLLNVIKCTDARKYALRKGYENTDSGGR
jgi:cell division protein FtsW